MAADRTNGILLDCSVVIVHLREQLDVFSFLQPGEKLYLPLVALAELYKGAEKSTRAEHNRALVDRFLRRVNLLYPGLATARVYASIAAGLESRGVGSLPRTTSGSLPSRWNSICLWRRGTPISTVWPA